MPLFYRHSRIPCNFLIAEQTGLSLNIAKSEQSSHTPCGSHPNLIGKKEKWTNKETLISNMWLNFYTQYNLSYLMFVPNIKILGKVVPEKSLTKISIFITLER